MKTDTQLKQDVVDELAWDPAVHDEHIGIAVNQGVVTVTGHLETFAEKVAVERALRRVEGVKAMALELDVRISPQHRRDDTDIAVAAEYALKWQTEVPAEKLRITVENGWITLAGEVDWDYQRQAAYKAVRPLIGVVGVSNEIRIRQRATPQGVASRIEEALKRQAVREAHKVQIDIADGTVTLRGAVNSLREREAIQGAAFSAAGVRAVVNELRVGA
jgi:osmotically-inducible protein OsmY